MAKSSIISGYYSYIAESAQTFTVGIFPGAFKPPHIGHLTTLKKAIEQCDTVLVSISSGEREGFTAEKSLAIWKLLAEKQIADGTAMIEISGAPSPMATIYNVANFINNNLTYVSGKKADKPSDPHALQLAKNLIKKSGGKPIVLAVFASEEDMGRYSSLTKDDRYIGKGVSKVIFKPMARPIMPNGKPASASELRAAITAKDKQTVMSFIPDDADKKSIYTLYTESTHIFEEGGNVFKANPTERIKKADIPATLKFISGILGFDVSNDTLGSTGKRDSNGDIDIGISEAMYTKDDIVKKLVDWCKQHGLEPKEYIAKSGISIHFRAPIAGNPKNGYVQADLMFGNLPMLKFFVSGAGDASKFTGADRNILLNKIAKTHNLTLSNTGLKTRDTKLLVSDNPSKIVKILLGDDANIADADSVETLEARLKHIGKTLPTDDKPLNEAVQDGAMKKHLSHLEDLLVEKGTDGFKEFMMHVDALTERLTTSTGTKTKNVNLKIDGSPAVVFGSDPTTHTFFCDLKYAVGKPVENRSHSLQEIQKNYSKNPAVQEIVSNLFSTLKACYDKPLNSGIVYQGDVLWHNPANKTYKDANRFSVTPNLLTYSFDTTHPDWKLVNAAKVGIIVHAAFHSTDNDTGLQLEMLNKDISQLAEKGNANGAWLRGSLIQNKGVVTDTQLQQIDVDVKNATKAVAQITSQFNEYYLSSRLQPLMQQFVVNYKGLHDAIANNKSIPSNILAALQKYLTMKAEKEAATKKTEKGKSQVNQRLLELLNTIKQQQKSVMGILTGTYYMARVKFLLLGALTNTAKGLFSDISVITPEGKQIPAADEGFVNYVGDSHTKLVDRAEFSRMNREFGKQRKTA